ncbi:HDOD domain-containing protein [Acidithiobacillus sp. IBUN Pt1247-S3]|uniref:HDOD domain-containing protein n=1 Tax=Acidithiobacillus sp. IBUN Pt1247-S3 TaxID=3166642 RepID=UPI0034E40CE9
MNVKEMARKLANEELPLLGANIAQILAVTSDESSSLEEIGHIVSRDPVLTALVLRMANSVVYSGGRASLNSLSRVLMILGLAQVRTLCFSAVVLESTVAAVYRERVLELLRTSLELAGQARFLADKFRANPEPYFLSGLLSQIGRIAFWCAGGEYADRLNQALLDGLEEKQAEQEILGFTLGQLDEALLDHWGLGTLQKLPTLSGIHVLRQARSLITMMRQEDSSGLERELLRLQPLFQQNSRDLLRGLRENRERSLALLPHDWLPCNSGRKKRVGCDMALQMQCLADMHALPKSGSYISTVVEMALDGLCRAGNWDYAVFALLTTDGWREKFSSGARISGAPSWEIDAIEPEDLLRESWKKVQICEIEGRKILQSGQVGAAGLLPLLDRRSGLLYVSSRHSNDLLLEAQFHAFDRFYRQLEKILAGLA